MSGNNQTSVDGLGALTYQRAIDIARNTEADLDPAVQAYLDRALAEIWARIQRRPNSYILTRDEFAVFNFYIRRFDGRPEAERAIARYWQNARQHPTSTRS